MIIFMCSVISLCIGMFIGYSMKDREVRRMAIGRGWASYVYNSVTDEWVFRWK